MTAQEGWYGIDFDGTLVTIPDKDIRDDPSYIGEPIWPTIYRVRQRLADGQIVKIFTGRVWNDGSEERLKAVMIGYSVISAFCLEIFGEVLPITNEKDPWMISLEDDRAVQIGRNTGYPVGWNNEW
jgi:hypothetical protein